MTTNDGEWALLAEVDRLQADVVDLTSRLVQIRSVNPRYPGVDYERELGGETRCNQLLEPVLAALGLETHRFAREPGRENLCATLRGTGGGKSLVFNGHVDTVAAVNLETWQHDPWCGRAEDGTVFGLGATDMKGDQLFADMTAVIETVTGTPAHIQGIACGCDATFLCEAGMNAVIYGPGDLSNAHRPNESVSVDELVEAAKVYALSALRFCR